MNHHYPSGLLMKNFPRSPSRQTGEACMNYGAQNIPLQLISRRKKTARNREIRKSIASARGAPTIAIFPRVTRPDERPTSFHTIASRTCYAAMRRATMQNRQPISLAGRKALITGIANDQSIAWGFAQRFLLGRRPSRSRTS